MTEDLTGNRYGRWTVLSYAYRNIENRKHLWLCECDCGTKKDVYGISLKGGSSESCGCLRSEITSIRSRHLADQRRENIIGRTFNKLTVIDVSHIDRHRVTHYNCKCECGITTVVRGSSVISGHTRSCGCLLMESAVTHGLTKHPLYMVWINLRRRCLDEDYEAFKNYGGRGITVCDQWASDFMCFFNWAISNGYRKSLTIDRIDNNDGYHPRNCRFTTREQQNRNRRTTKLTTVAVEDIRKSQEPSRILAAKYGVSMSTINDVRANKKWKNI